MSETGRKRLVIGVWKDQLGLARSKEEAARLLELSAGESFPFEYGIAPNPFAYAAVAQITAGSGLKLCAQNAVWSDSARSYIGETTIAMLREVGCDYVILGHSERRHHFGESNELIARRASSCMEAGLPVILCIGETADEKREGRSAAVLAEQLRSFISATQGVVSPELLVVAYEPVWAISTWRTDYALPDGDEVQAIHAELRTQIASLADADFTARLSLLYGGSVAADNAEMYMAQADVDGALVGGASKTAAGFMDVLRAAQRGFATGGA